MADTVTVQRDDVKAVAAVFGLALQAFGPAGHLVPGVSQAADACERMLAAAANPMPEDPVPVPLQNAITCYELMDTYVHAGFERSEAFTIVHTLIAANASVWAMRGMHG